MTTWKKYEVTNFKAEKPCITIRRSGFALSVPFMTSAKVSIGDFADVFTSNDGKIGFKFYREKQEGRLLVGPDGGGKKRIVDPAKANGLIVCAHVKNDTTISQLVGTKNSKMPAVFEDGMWVIRLFPQWNYDASVRKPTQEDIGVYRYSHDGEVVYIGRGKIAQRIASPERGTWQFDKIEYTLMSDEDSISHESRLIREHRDAFGRLPFYNRNVPSEK